MSNDALLQVSAHGASDSAAEPSGNGERLDNSQLEARRRLVCHALSQYLEVRRSTSYSDEEGYNQHNASSEAVAPNPATSSDRQRVRLNVTKDVLLSELGMLADILDRMSPSAKVAATRSSLLLLTLGVTTFISGRFLGAKSAINDFFRIAFVAGATYTGFQWLARIVLGRCRTNIRLVRGALEDERLTDECWKYLEGWQWSTLRWSRF